MLRTQSTCPDDGQPCECRDDSLSRAHCHARLREGEIRKAAQIVADGGNVAQRQDDTDSQMFDLKWIGVKFGLYDALDRLRRLEERTCPFCERTISSKPDLSYRGDET